MLQTVTTGIIGPVPICKNRLAPIHSTVIQNQYQDTKICSNSSTPKYVAKQLLLANFNRDKSLY